MTRLLASGFTDSFRLLYPDRTEAYSWWSYRFHAREKNAGWRIDYFIVSNRMAPKNHRGRIFTAQFRAATTARWSWTWTSDPAFERRYPFMATRYIVTGGAGHLGSTILRLLRRTGDPVRALILPGGDAGSAGGAHHLLSPSDVRDPDSLESPSC